MSDLTIRNATLADAPRILEIYAYYVCLLYTSDAADE